MEDDQVQGKGKAKVFTPERRDFRPDFVNPSKLRREFFSQAPWQNTQAIDSIFKEPIYRVLEKIKKNELYFKGANKIRGGPYQKKSKSVLSVSRSVH